MPPGVKRLTASAIDVGIASYEHDVCDSDAFATGWEVIIAIRRVQHRIEVFIDQSLEPLGLTFAQYRALEAIDANREMHVSELARLLRLSRQAVQSAIHKLDLGGLLELTSELPRLYVSASNVGKERLALFRRFTNDFKERIEEELAASQRGRIVTLLEHVDRSLDPPRQPEWWLAP